MKTTRRQLGLGAALAATLLATALTAWMDGGTPAAEGFAPPRSRADTASAPRADDTSASGPDAFATRPGAVAEADGPADVATATRTPGREAWPAVEPAALAAWGQGAPALDSRPAAVAARRAASVAEAAASAAPVAPPLAYRYVGRLVEDGRARAMLVSPQRTLLVAESEVVDGQWRVEHISERSVDLVWLPAALPHRLAFES